MPIKEKSTESLIKEHQKYQKQCEIRIATGKKLLITCLIISALLLIYSIQFWKICVGLLVFVSAHLCFEYWGYKKHEKAINQLSTNK